MPPLCFWWQASISSPPPSPGRSPLTGPLGARDEVLAERYRATLKSWFVVDFDAEIAESAARLRAARKLKLADAVQAASALAVGPMR